MYFSQCIMSLNTGLERSLTPRARRGSLKTANHEQRQASHIKIFYYFYFYCSRRESVTPIDCLINFLSSASASCQLAGELLLAEANLALWPHVHVQVHVQMSMTMDKKLSPSSKISLEGKLYRLRDRRN